MTEKNRELMTWNFLIFFTLFIVLLFCQPTFAADTVTCVKGKIIKTNEMQNAIQEITWNFATDDGTIAASSATTAVATNINGWIVGYEYIIDGDGDPDTTIDIVITDVNNVPVLGGAADNLGASSFAEGMGGTKSLVPILMVEKTLKFAASQVGSGSKNGKFKLMVQLP